MLINAAGLYAWDIAKMISPDLPYEKQYLRGEYFQFNRKDGLFIHANVYPVPILVDLPDGGHFLDLGAHVTPKVGPDERGNTQVAKEVLIGPIFTEVLLADELNRAGKRVILAAGEHVRMPRVYRGRDIQYWMQASGLLDKNARMIQYLGNCEFHISTP